MTTDKEILLTRGKKAHKEFGKITKIEFSNKSRIYISKKGWTLTLPKNKGHMKLLKKKSHIEIILSYAELNLAIKETYLAGYTQ